MKKYLFILFILIFTSPLIPLQRGKLTAQVPYRIRLSDSTYTAQLIGIAGKRTASDTVDGVWSSTYKLHEFDVEHTGPYQLYVDAAGGTNYVLVSSWGKSNGKAIPGYDWVTFWEAINTLSQLMSIGIGDTSICTDAYKDSSVTMPKLSTTVHAAMGAYGAGTYPPDDVELEFVINGSDTTISIKDSWLTDFRSEVGDSVKDAIKQTFYASNYATIDACVSAAGANESVVIVDGHTYNISGVSLTIPNNVDLKILRGGLIDATSNKDLNINGTFDAGVYQCFGDSVTVNFDTSAVAVAYPEWWGAKANDAASDVLYLESAINSLPSSGGLVRLIAGNYIADDIFNITGKDNIIIQGVSPVTTIKMSNGANKDQIILIDSCSNVVIDGIKFDNNESNQTGGELRCIQTQDSCYYLTIKNCIFEGNGRSAASGSYGIWLNYCYDSNVDNISVDGWTNHDFLRMSNAERINIRNSNFKNLQTSAITLTNQVRQIIVSNNFFYDIGDSTLARGHAVASNVGSTDETLWPREVIISDNVCTGCFGDVIIVEQGFRYIISGNIIRSFFTAVFGDTIGDTGISCSAEQSVIIGNHISGNFSPGITLFNNAKYATSYNMVVIGNTCFDNGTGGLFSSTGIWLDDVQRCIVADNICGDNIDLQNHGVLSSGTSKYNVVANNVLSLNQTNQLHFTNDSLLNVVAGNYEWQDGESSPDDVRLSSFYQQGDIDSKRFGGHKLLLSFYFDNIVADTTDATIYTTGGTILSYNMPKDGSVLAVSIRSNEARTAGTLSAEVNIWNAGIGLIASLDAINTNVNTVTQAKDTDTFPIEATISVKITSSSWAPTTADIVVSVLVEM